MNKQDVADIAEAAPFPDALQNAVVELRGALTEILTAIGADASRPQDLARQYGLNKNLTWKISKIVGSSDLFASVPHIPGTSGLEIFFSAMQKAGAPAELTDAGRTAARSFEQVVKVHTGDRTTLEIMVGDMLPAAEQGEKQEQNRKLAYQGNSGIWGVRARAQLTLNILAPSANDSTHADLVQVSGLIGFRRLRADARWLLFRRERWGNDTSPPPNSGKESLDPDYPIENGVPLLSSFCSRPIPHIDVLADTGEEQYELPPGPVGNTAAFTCIYGQIERRAGATQSPTEGEYIELGGSLTTPVERFIFDFAVHRSFEWAMSPELVVYSRMDGGGLKVYERSPRNLLPVTDSVQDLAWGTAGVATPHFPKYAKLVRDVFDRVGWTPADFRVFRVEMAYPPIPSVALLRAPIPVVAPTA